VRSHKFIYLNLLIVMVALGATGLVGLVPSAVLYAIAECMLFRLGSKVSL